MNKGTFMWAQNHARHRAKVPVKAVDLPVRTGHTHAHDLGLTEAVGGLQRHDNVGSAFSLVTE